MSNIWKRFWIATTAFILIIVSLSLYLSWWETGAIVSSEYLSYHNGRIYGKVMGLVTAVSFLYVVLDSKEMREWYWTGLFAFTTYGVLAAWYWI